MRCNHHMTPVRRLLVTLVTTVCLAVTLSAPADAAEPSSSADDVALLRVFLKDGSSVVSYGEYARVGEEVVLSMPLGRDLTRPTLQLVTLAVTSVDWPRTERYANSVRYQRYVGTRAEEDFARLSADTAAKLNEIEATTDRKRAIEIADNARRQLASWPAEHYGYRAADVADIIGVIDDAMSRLAGAGSTTAPIQVSLVAVPVVDALEPVLGLPGCAKSPKYNGFDMVLERLAAGLPVGRSEIVKMGAGGLLAEIPTRPQPRDDSDEEGAPQQAPRVAVLVLAAGRSTRMGGPNKLLAETDGQPLVVHAVKAALASQAVEVVVVLGHMADQVRAVIDQAVPANPRLRFVTNPDFAEGLSTSVRTGIAALGKEIDAAVVQLGDMPGVNAALLDRLMAAFSPVEGRSICVPTVGGKRGNPVLWDRRFFAEMIQVSGDTGAKHLIGEHADLVCEVEMTGEAAITDIDTPEALAAWRARKS